MASYHSSFTYLNKNSSGEGFIIASFEPDSGFVDSFLGMDQITTDSYNGIQKHFYGSKYNSSAEISITLVKPDGSDFSMEDNRRVFRWLTGNKQASWLDFYVGDKFVYSFYGSVTACQQQKLDARVIGIQVTFTSIHPWAYSAAQLFDRYVGNEMLAVDYNGVVYRLGDIQAIGVDANGVMYNGNTNTEMAFSITEDGIIYSDSEVTMLIDNKSDDLYSFINLNLVYKNQTGTSISIKNKTLNEESVVTNISPNEIITLSENQFITSSEEDKIFGDSFNFVWPRLRSGKNTIVVNTIDGNGTGSFHFSYRYPIKIGDCAIDVEGLGRNPMCESDISCAFGSSDGVTTLVRNNILLTDKTTGIKYGLHVVAGKIYFDRNQHGDNKNVVFVDYNNKNKFYEIFVDKGNLYISETNKSNDKANARERFVLLDTTNNSLYALTATNNRLVLYKI